MTIIEPSDVRPGDTIRIVTTKKGITVSEEGVVFRVHDRKPGLTAYGEGGTYFGRLDRFPAPDCIIHLLHRPDVSLARLEPGVVRSKDGREWLFDGKQARRPQAHEWINLDPYDGDFDYASDYEPWEQVATLADADADDPATTPPTSEPVKWGMTDAHDERITVGRTIDGAVHIGVGGTYAVLTDKMAADLSKAITDVVAGATPGKRTEYGVRYINGEVKFMLSAAGAVEEAARKSFQAGPRNSVEPVTRTNWGSHESAWNTIDSTEVQ